MNLHSTFHISEPIWVKFGTEDGHVLPFSSRAVKAVFYLGVQLNFASILYICRPIWIKVGTEDMHKNLFSEYGFHES
jgi:hypothetical protein